MNYEILVRDNGSISLVDVMRTEVDRSDVIGTVTTPMSRILTPGMFYLLNTANIPTQGIYLFLTEDGPVLSDVGRGDLIPPNAKSISVELTNIFSRNGVRTRVSKVGIIEPTEGLIFNPSMRTFTRRVGVYRQRAYHGIVGWKAGILPNQAYHAQVTEDGSGASVSVQLMQAPSVILYCSQKIPAARIAGHETINIRCRNADSISINGEVQVLVDGVATHRVPTPAKNIEIGLTFDSRERSVDLGGVEVW